MTQPQRHSADAPRNRANRYAHIDALRAAAILLVVVAHAGLGSIIPGGSGVTIFFAISGFIITFLVLRERDNSGGFRIGRFYFRRAMKIFPPLLVLLILPTLVYAAFVPIDWIAFIAQIGFAFNWYKVNGGGDVLPGSGVVWSLAIEEQFYLVFALLWIVLYRVRWYHTALSAIAAVAIVYSTGMRIWLTSSGADVSDRIYYSTDTRLDSIAWGVLTAVLLHRWMRGGEKPTTTSRMLSANFVPVLALSVFLCSLVIRDEWFRDTFRFTLQSLATCLLIVYGLLPGEGRFRQFFYRVSSLGVVGAIGLASYSIYLIHLPLMIAFLPVTENWPTTLRILTLGTLSVVCGYIAYRLVEVPALRLRKRAEESAAVRRPAAGGD